MPTIPDAQESVSSKRSKHSESGYVFVTFALLAVVLVASIGMAMDYGTAFVVRNEAQTFCDSAVLAATLELDGTNAGITRARQRALAIPNQWLYGNTSFAGVVVEFSNSENGPWEANPSNPVGTRYTRVAVTVTAPMAFLPIVTNEKVAQVRSVATAGQIEKTSFPNGVFPFSPFAHNASGAAGDFGFSKGTQYTLRWPNNMNKHAKPCEGDKNVQHVLDMKEEAGESVQGYIDSNSASDIRQAIINSEHTNGRTYTVGDPVFMASGNKQSMERAMQDRVLQDTNTTARTYSEYNASETGNGRRLVVVPVNEGPATNFRVAGFALFFLDIASAYQTQPSDSFCGEYVGSAVLGASNAGANPTGGAYAVRLVR